MKKNILLLAVVAVVITAFSSCNKGGKTGLLVPEDAAIVFHINNASLSSKLSWEEIKQSQWFSEAGSQAADEWSKKLLEDPSASGIDMKSDFVLFLKKEKKNGFLVVQGGVKDAAALENFSKQMDPGAATSKDGSISFTVYENKTVMAWNATHFSFVAGVPMPDAGSFMNRDRLDDEDYDFGSSIPVEELKAFGKKVLTLKKSERLDKDSRFADMIADGSDMHFWVNTEKYYGDLFGPVMSMFGNLSALTKGNLSASSFNFADGKITMTAKQYYGKEMDALVSKYRSTPISEETAGLLPTENVAAAMVMNYPPDGLNEMLKMIKVDGIVNVLLAQSGYSTDDFIKANKGDLLLAVTDFSIREKTTELELGNGKKTSYSTTEPDAKVLFATSVKDKAAFEKLITLLWDQSKELPMEAFPSISYRLENNWFAAGNDSAQVAKFLAGESKKSAFTAKISGHPFGFFVDLKKIMTVAATETKDSSSKAALAAALNTWEDITAWGGEYKNKAVEMYAEINLADKQTNSLKQLNGFLDKMAVIYKTERKKHLEEERKELKAF